MVDPSSLRVVVTSAAVAACVLLAASAVLQLLLVLGAPLGRFAWGGQHRVLHVALRVGSVMSIAIYAVVVAVVAARADLVSIGVPDSSLQVATWVAARYFLLDRVEPGFAEQA